MLASANDRYQRSLADLKEENATLEVKVKDMQEKVRSNKSYSSEMLS